ncbi:hypothetical protein Tco_0418312 [Tanacetum coccineum]
MEEVIRNCCEMFCRTSSTHHYLLHLPQPLFTLPTPSLLALLDCLVLLAGTFFGYRAAGRDSASVRVACIAAASYHPHYFLLTSPRTDYSEAEMPPRKRETWFLFLPTLRSDARSGESESSAAGACCETAYSKGYSREDEEFRRYDFEEAYDDEHRDAGICSMLWTSSERESASHRGQVLGQWRHRRCAALCQKRVQAGAEMAIKQSWFRNRRTEGGLWPDPMGGKKGLESVFLSAMCYYVSGLQKFEDTSRTTQNQQQPFKRNNVARAYTAGPGRIKKPLWRNQNLFVPKCINHTMGHVLKVALTAQKEFARGHSARDCKVRPTANNNNNNNNNNQRTQGTNPEVITCFECGVQGHFRSQLPKTEDGV